MYTYFMIFVWGKREICASETLTINTEVPHGSV